MKKIAIYVRVSSDCQTVENQKLSLIEFAATHHYIYDLFEEVQSTRQTRPVKQELLSKLRQKQYDAVVVYKLDRWARSSFLKFGRPGIKKRNWIYFTYR